MINVGSRKDRREPCRRCRSDLNSHLLIRCSTPTCTYQLHTYCFDPPRYDNDPPRWFCPRCSPTAATLPRSLKIPIDTLTYAKQRALKLPKPAKEALESPKASPIVEARASTFDWKAFCDDRVHSIETPRQKRKSLQPIVQAWINWRRKQPSLRRRILHMETYATKKIRSIRHVLTDSEAAQQLPDWREKYADEPDYDYSKSSKHKDEQPLEQQQPPPKERPLAPPPPKAPPFVPPESIQVESYSINVPQLASNDAIQTTMKQVSADREAARRRIQAYRKQLVLQLAASQESTAASRIQRWLRRCRRRRSEAQARHAAATVINLFLRRSLARKHHRQNHAASMLDAQRTADAKRHLKAERSRKRARKRIDLFLVKRVVPYLNRKSHAVARIQRQWRRYCRWKNLQVNKLVVIQCAWRQALARRFVQHLREARALEILHRHIRGWFIRRVVYVEQKRVALVSAAQRIVHDVADAATASIVFHTLGLYYYSTQHWWEAAACLERTRPLLPRLTAAFLLGARRNGHPKSDDATSLALARSHHEAWHRSYDPFNLDQAFSLYTSLLTLSEAKSVHANDPAVLHDYAVLLFERNEYIGGLDVMTHLLACYPDFEQMKTSVLWVGVVLQYLQRGEESVQYLSSLLDAPPAPFTAMDMTILCALGYHCSHSIDNCKQGLQAAVAMSKASTGRKRSKLELIFDFAARASTHGHYLLAYLLLYYGLHRVKQSTSEPWVRFADTLRHLGRLDKAQQALDAAYELDPRISPRFAAPTFRHELDRVKDMEYIGRLV
ncbi:unnamed protein product [Aphanomyces euteiches]